MGARFEGKVAIVTGAAKGMGLATAIEMCRDGASVMMTDIDKAGLEAAARQIRSSGGKVTTEVCDIADRAQVDALVHRTSKELGRLDILVNNAGLLLPGDDRRDDRRYHRPDP